MPSIYGEKIHVSIFGQSHSAAIGVVIDGLPAGVKIDMAELGRFMARRAPGQGKYATARKEADLPALCQRRCGRRDLRRAGVRADTQYRYPIGRLRQSARCAAPVPRRLSGICKVRRRTRHTRRRSLFRQADRAAVHCGRNRIANAQGARRKHRRAYCLSRQCKRRAL